MSTAYSSQCGSSSTSVIDNDDPLGRRKLLLVYIHGFMGDESSFRSFPAHVHSLLTVLLRETHAVYSKIYPRYRSKRHLSVARDDFSNWLAPHESDQTDVILLGHSMGGLLAAEIALMPSHYPDEAFKHEILGTINFDVPFLGMHPGVVTSGLASLFLPSNDAPADKYRIDESATTAETKPTIDEDGTINLMPGDTFWQPAKEDQTFNARFNNDVVLPARKFWESVQHFVHKHSADLTSATTNLVTSHVEFMSAMSNASELRQRYTRLRLLEEDNATIRKTVVKADVIPPRIRFVNFYTASTGRPKHPKDAKHSTSVKDEAPTNGTANEMAVVADDVQPSVEITTIDQTAAEEVKASGKAAASQADPLSTPPKDRKFCNLPPRDSTGERDPTWVRIFMQNVDEVGAHCGMFFVDDRYEQLVAAVAEKVENWIQDATSVKLIHASQRLLPASTKS